VNLNIIFRQYQGLPRDLYILAVARAIASAGAFVMPMMTLILTQKMGLTIAQSGWLVSCASASFIPGSLLGGKLADQVGRKKVMVTAEVLAGVSWVICGFFPESIYVIPFIFVANFCWGAIEPSATALATDLTTPAQRKAAFSLSYLGHNIGIAVGPLIAGFLFLNHARWMFWGDGITTLVGALLVIVFVSESKPPLNQQAHTEQEASVVGSVWPVLWARRFLLWFTAANFLLAFCYAQMSFTLPLQLQAIFGDAGARNFGLVMTVNALTVLVFTPLMITLTRNLHSIFNVAITGALYCIGFGMIFWLNSLWLFFLSTIIWTLGETMHHINANAYIASHSPQSHRARINSILPLIYGTGYGLAPMLVGFFIEWQSLRSVWLLVMLLAGLGTICMVFLGRNDLKRMASNQAVG
jgi:MFS family permease